jgi:hypothetical protein
MRQYPSIPRVENAPESLFDGHLWILELVDGAQLRFKLRQSGRLRFGTETRVFDDPEDVPDPFQHAVGHVQRRLDRQALRRAVDDVESVVFFGEAMHRHAVDYDWDRTPSFLGFDVWSDSEERFRPPDAAEQIFDRLGLQPVNVFERERRGGDFDPDSYTVPQSAWYDGPAAGVVLRNKRGERAKLTNPAVEDADDPDPPDASAAELASAYATDRRFETLAAEFERRDQPVTFQRLYERVLEDIVRKRHRQLYHSQASVEMSEFRSAVAARTRDFLDGDG